MDLPAGSLQACFSIDSLKSNATTSQISQVAHDRSKDQNKVQEEKLKRNSASKLPVFRIFRPSFPVYNFACHCHTHYNLQLDHDLRLQSLCIAQYTVMLPYSSCSRPPCSRIILGADKSTAEQARAAGCIKQSVLPLTMVSVSEGRTKHQKASKLQNEYVRLN